MTIQNLCSIFHDHYELFIDHLTEEIKKLTEDNFSNLPNTPSFLSG